MWSGTQEGFTALRIKGNGHIICSRKPGCKVVILGSVLL